jgi:hypothetical protein
MQSRLRGGLVVLLVAGGVASGCGGASDGTTGSAGASGPAAEQSSGQSRNACGLVDRAELEAIAGRPVTVLHDVEADDQTTCEIRDAAETETVLVYVTVQWTGGKELAEAEQAAMGLAKSLLNEPDVDIEALTGSGDVPGLADQAYYSDVMPSWVLEDDVMIKVISPRFGHDQTKSTFLSVAKTALSRLQ